MPVLRSLVVAVALSAACGPPFRVEGGVPAEEICDGIDNDGDQDVDEDFRDPEGRYHHLEHCGACNNPCTPNSVATEVACEVRDTGPACVARACGTGYALAARGLCVRRSERMCQGCAGDLDCGSFAGAVCGRLGGEARCTVTCSPEISCPGGYRCNARGECEPEHGDCACVPGAWFAVGCDIPVGDQRCPGTAVCTDGTLSECFGDVELCDGLDNDCNGVIDDPFVNELGAYAVELSHCGGCGIDCTRNPIPGRDLTCGGPPTEPRCALACGDTADGLDIGDRVDADLVVANGCECTIHSFDDPPGGDPLDANCDGADGVAARSYYVAVDGDDQAAGSPVTPLGTLVAAVEAASQSLTTGAPRPHVLVAGGSYGEVLEVRGGVHVHGGYAPDFRSRDPESYPTEIHPPHGLEGGAGLSAQRIEAPASVDGVWIRGVSATVPQAAAVGAHIRECRALVTIRDSVIEAGEGADGVDGSDGVSGAPAFAGGGTGAVPRAADEDASHACVDSDANRVAGGLGHAHQCGAVDVSGGDGGSAHCAGAGAPYSSQAAGAAGQGSAGGAGGSGGWDATGPIYMGGGCLEPVCCGLADFLVSGEHENAEDGEAGGAGADGEAGAGCSAALGAFDDDGHWRGTEAGDGTVGHPGSGGGGGGAGGSAAITWEPDYCEFADGLGGGGGGGGAGGCGGSGGAAGTAGSPSIGVLIVNADPADVMPVLENVRIVTRAPGAGGRGGVGGAGGLGGPGGAGGELAPEERITPSLSGTSFGGRGGPGGPGGNGGGGGGGCGGSSVGIWIRAPQSVPGAEAAYRAANQFLLAPAGEAGRGGGGSTLGGDGAAGEVRDVVAP